MGPAHLWRPAKLWELPPYPIPLQSLQSFPDGPFPLLPFHDCTLLDGGRNEAWEKHKAHFPHPTHLHLGCPRTAGPSLHKQGPSLWASLCPGSTPLGLRLSLPSPRAEPAPAPEPLRQTPSSPRGRRSVSYHHYLPAEGTLWREEPSCPRALILKSQPPFQPLSETTVGSGVCSYGL